MSILATEKLISSVKYKAVARLAVRLRKANNNKEPNKNLQAFRGATKLLAGWYRLKPSLFGG